jgi:hypothetical protein
MPIRGGKGGGLAMLCGDPLVHRKPSVLLG